MTRGGNHIQQLLVYLGRNECLGGRSLLTAVDGSPVPPLTTHRKSLKALTGIRFFAAVDVVILHSKLPTYLAEHHYRALGTFFSNGSLAVALFFLLSGFILSYTYEGQIQRPTGYRRFWEARLARIWPVYVVSLLFTSAVTRTVPKWSYVVATLLMVQAWNPFDNLMWGAWNFVCWTISAEAFFYLCFPWLQQQMQRLTVSALVGCTAALLVLCVTFNLSVYAFGFGQDSVLNALPRPLLRLPDFAIGMTLGNLFLRLPAGGSRGSHRPLMFVQGLWTYLWAVMAVALLCRAYSHWTSLVTVAFAALIFGLAAERTWLSRFLSTPIMILGGGISYSVYLLQEPVKDLIKVIAAVIHLDSSLFRIAAMAIALMAISLLLFKTVEGPGRDKLRFFFANLEKKRNA